MTKRKYALDMTSGAILPKLLKFSIPLMLSSVLQLFFNAADIIVVGNFAGSNSLAAVGATADLVNLMTNLFLGLSVSANVLSSRYMGARDNENLSKTVHTSIALSIACGAFLSVFGIVFAKPLLSLMNTPDEVIDLSALYLRIYFVGMIAMMLYNFGSSILRSKGDTKRPLYYLTLSGAINLLLNLLFVIVFKMDVAGVAIATVASQITSAVLVIRCLMKEEGAFKLEVGKLKIDRKMLLRTLQIGLPAGLQGVLFSLSNVIIQSSVNGFGPIVMSGSAAASSIETFVWVSMNAFSQGALTFMSQNIGAGKFSRLNRVVLISNACSAAVGLVLGQLVVIFSETLLGIYDPRPEILGPGIIRLSLVCGFYFVCGAMDCMAGAIRGMGYSVMPTVVALIGACGLRILYIFTIFQLPELHNVTMLFISYPVTWGITFAAHLVCYIIVRKKLPKADIA